MIDLVLEGHLPPTTEQLATRAGVSVASVFRYFDGLEDLERAATALYFDRFDHLIEIPQIGTGSLRHRVERIVDARLRLYDTAEPMGRLVRRRAPEHARADANLALLRATYTGQIEEHFDAELSAPNTTGRKSLVAIVATLTSFEAWDQCRNVHGLEDSQISAAWATSLIALLRGRA